MRDYLLPLLCIVFATLGLLKVRPFGIEYSDTELILGILGVLAVANVTERLGILNSMDIRLTELQHHSLSQFPQVQIANRGSVPRMSDRVNSAHEEIVICGPSLDGAVSIVHQLALAASRGVSLKILVTLPTRENMKQYGRHLTASNYDLVTPSGIVAAQAKIRHNINTLKQELSHIPNVEVKTFDGLIWCGYVMVDRMQKSGTMDIQLYMYKIPADTAPLFQVSRAGNYEWHAFFSDAFDIMWRDAVTA
ncbi:MULTISPECIES: hypothetical protein [unclassified Streptomyces]|uniref:hypothetical protein n=1 Tax=unclassified Streptomyces TaxID=2593676 RepID=UPI0007130367|nr:hypothetical protein [Streptomyces sp. Root264]KRD23366.1 hypothetical protein ASE41_10285 [Streptomyces sp. Root264]